MSTTALATAAPRIHSLHIRNFQSLHDVALSLEPFTVIVGPSSSGKSALTRALRTLVSNRRGTEWITHGEHTASITASTDAGTCTLTRSRTQQSAANAYTLTPYGDTTDQRTYAKLGGDTPEDVSRFLGIDSGSTTAPPINFAGQFDKPFLLDDSAADVARTLGALTGVNVIFEAARESNRQKLAASSTLKLRTQDLDAVRARIPEFKALRAQDDMLVAAEASIATLWELTQRIGTLEQAIDYVETLEPLITRLEPLASLQVPDAQCVQDAQNRLQELTAAISRVSAYSKALQDAQSVYDQAETDEETVLNQYALLSGSITNDLSVFFSMTMDPRLTLKEHGTTYVTVPHAVEVFLKFLETKASS